MWSVGVSGRRSPRQKAPAGDRPFFQGTASEVLEDIRRYAGLGVSHFVFDPVVHDLKAVLANMERFAHEVMPKAKANQNARPVAKKIATRTPVGKKTAMRRVGRTSVGKKIATLGGSRTPVGKGRGRDRSSGRA